MAQYDILAKFYDEVIGINGVAENFISRSIKKYNNKAETLLDLGCGTGSNLEYLNKHYNVTGIDASVEMISIAKSRLPEVNFIKGDITSFNLPDKYDVIVCLYDTINHITDFSGWKNLFKTVDEHLNSSGLFIFDMNTLAKLEYMEGYGSYVHKFGDNYMIMDVIKSGKLKYDWDAKIFENTGDNNFLLHREVITESSFNEEKVETELLKYFEIVDTVEDMGYKGSKSPHRIYYVCKKLDN